jgi:uncharacterized cupredoxin-like copper-binding protein
MTRRRVLPFAALLAGLVLAVPACSLPQVAGGGGEHAGHAHPAAPADPVSPAAGAPGPTWATGTPVRVVMDDRFRYRPASIVVRAGRRVTFAVTNAGHLPHEFILGDRATQLAHEHQMQGRMESEMSPGAPMHHHDHALGGGALTVPPGATRRLTWTFDQPGLVLYGCHVLGHWAAGMKGTIMVVAPDRPLPR